MGGRIIPEVDLYTSKYGKPKSYKSRGHCIQSKGLIFLHMDGRSVDSVEVNSIPVYFVCLFMPCPMSKSPVSISA